jgi:hypothetical protein
MKPVTPSAPGRETEVSPVEETHEPGLVLGNASHSIQLFRKFPALAVYCKHTVGIISILAESRTNILGVVRFTEKFRHLRYGKITECILSGDAKASERKKNLLSHCHAPLGLVTLVAYLSLHLR